MFGIEPSSWICYTKSMTLEEEIRELCTRALATEDPVELRRVLTHLRVALHQHNSAVKSLVSSHSKIYEALPRTNRPSPSDKNQER